MSILQNNFARVVIGVVLLSLVAGCAGPSEPPRQYVSSIVMMNAAFARGQGTPFAPSLVVFDMGQDGQISLSKVKYLNKVASKIYDLYTDDCSSHRDPAMVNFIKQVKYDIYRPHFRMAVPPSLTNGRQLYIADIMLHRTNLNSGSKTLGKVAVVSVTGEEDGTVRHIPFDDTLVRRY